MPSREKLLDFTTWCQNHITGDEKGQAQIFLDRLFQGFGQARWHSQISLRKSDEVPGA